MGGANQIKNEGTCRSWKIYYVQTIFYKTSIFLSSAEEFFNNNDSTYQIMAPYTCTTTLDGDITNKLNTVEAISKSGLGKAWIQSCQKLTDEW